MTDGVYRRKSPRNRRDGICPKCEERPRPISANGRRRPYCNRCAKTYAKPVTLTAARREKNKVNARRYMRQKRSTEEGRKYLNEAHTAWTRKNPGKIKLKTNERRATRAGVLMIVRVESDVCGVCYEPLTNAPFPDPMSTTTGHEPPLSVVRKDGWRIVCERPEHWKCNSTKADRMDTDVHQAG